MRRRRLLLLAPFLASCNALLGIEDTYPRTALKDCAAWRASGETTDGVFTIDPDGTGPNPPFDVYCQGMDAIPQEFLELTAPSPTDAANALGSGMLDTVSNYVIQTGGGDCACAGAEVSTFAKVRLDPVKLEINVFDRTFAAATYTMANQGCFGSTAGCSAGSKAFAEATNCNLAQDMASRSRAAVDLGGTPFFLADTSWVRTGRLSLGQGVVSADRKKATINGGGDCGGMVPQNGRLPVSFSGTLPAPAPLLANGSFDMGVSRTDPTGNLNGWTTTGGGSSWVVTRDVAFDNRMTLSSYPSSSDAAQGTVSQSFVVPRDAIAIDFAIAGTGGRVILRDGATELQTATPAIDAWIAKTFWIQDLTGKTITLVVEDATASAHIKVSGFDVRRGNTPTPILNPGFVDDAPFAGWTRSGDLATAARAVAADVNRGVWEATSFNPAGETPQGAVSQTFTVPNDAVALRFAVTGGTQTVKLYSGSPTTFPAASPVFTVTGPGDGYLHAASWDLTPYRGTTMTIAFEDFSTGSSFTVLQLGYVNTSYGP